MTNSVLTPLQRAIADTARQISDESEIANSYMQQVPGLTRTQALLMAARHLRNNQRVRPA